MNYVPWYRKDWKNTKIIREKPSHDKDQPSIWYRKNWAVKKEQR